MYILMHQLTLWPTKPLAVNVWLL